MNTSRKRTGPPLPPPEPRQCAGSWLPEAYQQPGEEVACGLCGRPVRLVAPPAHTIRDPWPGSPEARVEPHKAGPRGRRAAQEFSVPEVSRRIEKLNERQGFQKFDVLVCGHPVVASDTAYRKFRECPECRVQVQHFADEHRQRLNAA